MDKDTLKLILTVVIAPIVVYFAKKLIDFGAKKFDKEEAPPLTEHPFFERMKCLRNNILFSFKLANKGKEEIFRDILTNKFNIFIEKMWRTCDEIEKSEGKLNDSAFYNLVMDRYREAVHECSVYYKGLDYSDDELKCISIVMKKFNKWNYARIDSTAKSIEMISNSNFYEDNRVRMASILDMMLGQFVDTLNDAERTLNELNGDLKGLKFKDIEL